MKKRASAVVLAALLALMVASGASAKKQYVHANAKQARHGLVKQAKKSVDKAQYRRAGRHSF